MKTGSIRFTLILSLLICFVPVTSPAADSDVLRASLANGLLVLIV